MTNPISDILSKIYVEVPEVPNHVIGLSNNMIAEANQALTALLEAAIGEASTNVYGPEDSLPLNKWARFISDQDYVDAYNAGYKQRGDDIRQKLGIPQKETKQ
jgi:hypothetical protein